MRWDLELAGSWGLLFLVLAAVRLVPLLHSLELLWGQDRFHLLVRALMDRADLGLLLIGAERRIVVHGRDLRLGVFAYLLHLRFLIIGQIEIRTRPLGLLGRSGLGLSGILWDGGGAGEHRRYGDRQQAGCEQHTLTKYFAVHGNCLLGTEVPLDCQFVEHCRLGNVVGEGFNCIHRVLRDRRSGSFCLGCGRRLYKEWVRFFVCVNWDAMSFASSSVFVAGPSRFRIRDEFSSSNRRKRNRRQRQRRRRQLRAQLVAGGRLFDRQRETRWLAQFPGGGVTDDADGDDQYTEEQAVHAEDGFVFAFDHGEGE
jgi:hypothetical protein